jgi:hypothetical protein
MRLFGVLLVLVGCHAGSVTPDGSTEPDGPARSQGVTVTWNARPSLPGVVTDKVTVTDAVFQLAHLQLVSDAGGPTQARLQLAWAAAGSPVDEEFPEAGAAHYQQILLDMRSDVRPPYAYQIEGTWQDDEDSGQFRIADPNILEVPVACDVMLPASGSVTVAVRLDLRNVFNGINFGNLPIDGGGVRVLSSGPSLLGVRDQLMHHAFVQDN